MTTPRFTQQVGQFKITRDSVGSFIFGTPMIFPWVKLTDGYMGCIKGNTIDDRYIHSIHIVSVERKKEFEIHWKETEEVIALTELSHNHFAALTPKEVLIIDFNNPSHATITKRIALNKEIDAKEERFCRQFVSLQTPVKKLIASVADRFYVIDCEKGSADCFTSDHSIIDWVVTRNDHFVCLRLIQEKKRVRYDKFEVVKETLELTTYKVERGLFSCVKKIDQLPLNLTQENRLDDPWYCWEMHVEQNNLFIVNNTSEKNLTTYLCFHCRPVT